MNERKVTLGDVGLSVRGGERSQPICGEERVAALDAIYRGADCGFVPVDNRMGKGFRQLERSQIEWHADFYRWGTDQVRGRT